LSLATLFPHLVGRHLERVEIADDVIIVHLASARCWAACPLCRRRSRCIHATDARTLADLPVAGRTLILRLRVRRFRCANAACPRRIFAERFPTLAGVRARRTHAQRTALEQIGFALGGAAGARLAGPLGIVGSRATLLRVVHATPTPPAVTPRVLGVDDWARRRGQSYGTILVDLEQRRVVDLLADRTAAAFAAWLSAHPGVGVIARDRAGADADGARQGAPDAIQVADRFPVLANIGETLARMLARKHALLREVTAAVNRAREAIAEPAGDPGAVKAVAAGAPTRPPTRADQEKAAHRAARLARDEAVLALDRQGASQVQIAAQLGSGRKTVRRFLRAGIFPERAGAPRRPSMLDPYEPYLRERWAAGCHNSLQRWREIRERGFSGAASLVRRRVGRWRTVPRRRVPPRGGATPRPTCPPETPLRVPSARPARWFLLHPETRLRPDELLWRATLLGRDPEIRAARDLAQGFGTLVRERDHAALAPWLTQAAASDLPEFERFATVLERDRAAVEAARTSAWSSGQTEGQITKLKLLKRQAYGRASFTLLRKRALRVA